jgi:UPF0042 nucleotide-binding protein
VQTSDEKTMSEDAGASSTGAQTVPGFAVRRIVFVTGMSGAGRSTALDILEDLGYEAIDNPPLEFLEAIVATPGMRPIALGVDIRTRDFAADPFLETLDRLHADRTFAPSLLFVDCDEEVLGRRYTETRRRHPLAQGRPLKDGIEAERRLVVPLRNRADLVVDTTAMSPGDFRQFLAGHLDAPQAGGMAIVVTSFAYRKGLPRAADLVFDVRFLRNPHYEPALRDQTGRTPEVAAFVAADPHFQPFLDQITATLRPLLPRYEQEGKSYLTLALGCTGGRHRSVAVAESLARWLRDEGCRITLLHRDLETPSERA